MPNPWNIIGWLLLLAIVVAVVVVVWQATERAQLQPAAGAGARADGPSGVREAAPAPS